MWKGIQNFETDSLSRSSVLFFQPAVSSVYLIHHIQHLTYGCPYRICLGHEFLIIADMTVEVVKEFLRNIKTYFWHVLTFFKKMNYIELIGFNALATTFRDYSKNVTEEENKEKKKQKSNTNLVLYS